MPKITRSSCSYAVVDEWDDDNKDDRVIKVDNVLRTFSSWQIITEKLKIPIIAVTGTNGKTTTKELIAISLSRKFKVAFTQGNFNNHIGFITLLSMDKSHEIESGNGCKSSGDIKNYAK